MPDEHWSLVLQGPPVSPVIASPPAPLPPPIEPTAEAIAPGAARDTPSAPASVSASPLARGARIYAKSRFVWIQAEARPSNGWIGFLSHGTSALLRGGSVEAARAPGFGC